MVKKKKRKKKKSFTSTYTKCLSFLLDASLPFDSARNHFAFLKAMRTLWSASGYPASATLGHLLLFFLLLASFTASVDAQQCSKSTPCKVGCCSKWGFCGYGKDCKYFLHICMALPSFSSSASYLDPIPNM